MNKFSLSILLTLLSMLPAHAAWVLDSESSTLSFISTKAVNVAEVHRFAMLEGAVNDSGEANVRIQLGSVDTNIEIRDERMRGMLFETENHPFATITARVDVEMLGKLAVGESMTTSIEGVLTLHGETVPMPATVVVTRTGESGLLVASQQPVVVNAPLFGLGEGVERLREVAGLPSISTAVPVSFVLSFDAAD